MVKKAKSDTASGSFTEIHFYVEGGRNRTDDVEFRKAFHKFFESLDNAAKAQGIGIHPKFGGSRQTTYKLFSKAFGREDGILSLLLVDSEGPVAKVGKPWEHLSTRQGDGWVQPAGVEDKHCHLMAQAMEARFFADLDALAEFYDGGFLKNALSKRQNVEEIPKGQHIDSLERATKQTSKKKYDKFSHGPQLLMRIDPEKVRARAPHCDRIFVEVGKMIGVDLRRREA